MVLAALLLAAAAVPDLEVTLSPAPGRLSINLAVERQLPEEWREALAGGAPVSITYRLRLFRNRRWLWDQRLAGHELIVKGQRDPLTGVFTLVAELDGGILASGQTGGLDEMLLELARLRAIETTINTPQIAAIMIRLPRAAPRLPRATSDPHNRGSAITNHQYSLKVESWPVRLKWV